MRALRCTQLIVQKRIMNIIVGIKRIFIHPFLMKGGVIVLFLNFGGNPERQKKQRTKNDGHDKKR